VKQAYDILVLGGGAAGFFTALNVVEKNPGLTVAILERGKEVLTKVKVSGGGRCNVTHAEFLPKELSQNYPRGEKELLGPFHTFMTGDTMGWFETRGVPLKVEDDGRVFPVSDSSQSIIDCFLKEAQRLHIDVLTQTSVKQVTRLDSGFEVSTNNGKFTSEALVVATGSNPKVWKLLEGLGHTIVPPVPSLFTFNIEDTRITDLPGVATEATVMVLNEAGKPILTSEGPLLITHWGMSGPAILKLSAWGARLLEPLKYQFTIAVNWLQGMSLEAVLEALLELKTVHPNKTLYKYPQLGLPKRLWQNLLVAAGIPTTETWAQVSKKSLQAFSEQLTQSTFEVLGKSTFKEEFVTAGGVDLKEIHFKTFESKVCPQLYLAGEVLDVDAITGGFNFQNAWTGGYMIAEALANKQNNKNQ
tara:strand:- start:72083 stop:73330 length:1248 start_codon:yes stop_codon:yes gene_type:complete